MSWNTWCQTSMQQTGRSDRREKNELKMSTSAQGECFGDKVRGEVSWFGRVQRRDSWYITKDAKDGVSRLEETRNTTENIYGYSAVMWRSNMLGNIIKLLLTFIVAHCFSSKSSAFIVNHKMPLMYVSYTLYAAWKNVDIRVMGINCFFIIRKIKPLYWL